MSVTKAGMLKEYQKIAKSCRKELKTCASDDLGIPAIKKNLATAEHWIKFLTNPSVPELGDPNFNEKMKKL